MHFPTCRLPPDPEWPRGRPLRLSGVKVARGGREILQGIDLEFLPDDRCVLVGPSGSGKSTLIRLLNRLDSPDEGTIRLGDAPLSSIPVRSVRRGIGLVFQGARPLPGSVAENLAYPFHVRGLPDPSRDCLAGSLEEVGLDPSWLDRDAARLSGGERQRLALAVALAADPEILALDEPTAALDPLMARRMADLLDRRASSDGLRTIAVTHHREHAAWLGASALILGGGRIIDRGPVAEVLERTDAAQWTETSR